MNASLQLIEDNFEGHISKIPSIHPQMHHFASRNIVFVDSGISEDTFNIIHIKNGETLHINELKDAIDYYKKLNFSFCIWVSKENLTLSLKEIFIKLQLSKQAEELGMILNLNNYRLNKNKEELNVFKVNTNKLLLDYAHVIALHWSPTNNKILQFYNNSKRIYLEEKNGIFLFLYYHQNQPVATIELFATDQHTIGIYGLTTLKEFRAKGIGTALLRYALNFAKEQGYSNVVLQATEDGFNLYERLGFKVYTNYYEYS